MNMPKIITLCRPCAETKLAAGEAEIVRLFESNDQARRTLPVLQSRAGRSEDVREEGVRNDTVRKGR